MDTWEDIEKAFKAESEAIEAETTEEERKAVAAKLKQKLADPEYAKLLKDLRMMMRLKTRLFPMSQKCLSQVLRRRRTGIAARKRECQLLLPPSSLMSLPPMSNHSLNL